MATFVSFFLLCFAASSSSSEIFFHSLCFQSNICLYRLILFQISATVSVFRSVGNGRQMKERHLRWRSEEDAILRAYVKQYGPREWHLVSHRMSVALHRDAKSCLERWKNYLNPGIKKGSLTEDEQRLVIRLQAKHGNKWKNIAAEVPGRTAKRLGKWWEVFKEKQQRELRDSAATPSIEPTKYDRILENFAEKLVKERQFVMTPPATMLPPPWHSPSNCPNNNNSTPSVALTLSLAAPTRPGPGPGPCVVVSELGECFREMQEGHQAWAAHRKEAAWRLKRVELQLEAEKACKRREKMEEVETKVRALKEEEKAAMERIEAEYREQVVALRRDAEAKEQKLAEQWAARHARLGKLMEQLGVVVTSGSRPRPRPTAGDGFVI